MEAECTDLSPGKTYRVRVQCKSAGGKSDWSDVSSVTTEAVCPGVCHPPRLLGKPKASQLQLKWGEYSSYHSINYFGFTVNPEVVL